MLHRKMLAGTCALGVFGALGALLGSLLASGCSGSSGSDEASKFVGTWTFDSGAVTPSCPQLGNVPPIDLTGQTGAISKTDNTHIKVQVGNSCIVTFAVSGSTAAASSGQTCTLNTTAGAQSLSINSWTLTLSGSMISTQLAGSALLGQCTVTGTGMLTQHAG
jgi:hypothetical protein